MKKTALFALAACILLTALAAACREYFAHRAFILIYHKTHVYKDGDGYRGLVVAPGVFDRQMALLRRRGYACVSLAELAALVKAGKPLPKKIFAVTFDDGHEDNFRGAYPVLAKHGFTATILLNTGALGNYFQYPPLKPELHLSAAQVRAMGGVADFGSHTLSHPDLTTLPPDRLEAELRDSKAAVERITGKPCNTFAYPYGRVNAAVAEAAERYYDCAVTTVPGFVTAKSDPWLLPRFQWKETRAMGLNDLLANAGFYFKVYLGI